jgi:hypothetical protein
MRRAVLLRPFPTSFLRLGLNGIRKSLGRRARGHQAARDRYIAFELFELAGKRALVTDSSQGIGFALAQGLVEHGRDAAKLDAAAAKLAAAGHKVSVAGFDVTQAQAAKDGVEAIENNSGAIDILINNAGMQFRSPPD